MISPKLVHEALKKNNIDFYAGVPDSLLKSFCAYITDHASKDNHIITANEGNSIALGIGYHLATKKMPLIYMQNSGLGNTINPLLSLADSDVYSIPMILMIGWRGEPLVKDEPQHKKQGRITLELLDLMEIPYEILSEEDNELSMNTKILNTVSNSLKNNHPSAIVVKKNTFEKYTQKDTKTKRYDMSREDAIKIIINAIGDQDIVVSTTGVTSRELFEYTEDKNLSHKNNFYTVGGMGHANQIALGIAMQNQSRNVYCFDGDGAIIMHMGSMAIIGQQKCKNFKHIVFNNGCHDSVGGQPTVGYDIDMQKIATSMNYDHVIQIKNMDELKSNLSNFIDFKGSVFIEIKIKKGYRDNLIRPTTTPEENKQSLMDFLDK